MTKKGIKTLYLTLTILLLSGSLLSIQWLTSTFDTVQAQANGNAELISVSPDGEPGNAPSFHPVVSEDGRFVAFISEATNLVDPPPSETTNLYLYDRDTETIRFISSSNGNKPSMSKDGNYIVFKNVNNKYIHIYDVANNTTTQVQFQFPYTNYNAYFPSISPDGRYIAYVTAASLDPDDICISGYGTCFDIYVYDRSISESKLISRRVITTPTTPTYGSTNPVIANNGSFVAFTSLSPYLVENDTNGERDIFIDEGGIGSNISMVPVTPESIESSDALSISADGRYIVFESFDSRVGIDHSKPFIYDRLSQTVTRVSDFESPKDLSCNHPHLSGNGRYIAISCETIVSGPPPPVDPDRGLYIYDIQTGQAEKISDLISSDMFLSHNARYFAFSARYFAFSARYQVYVSDLLENDPPSPAELTISYSTGAPSSYFTVTGSNYPSNSTATIIVNGRTLGSVSTSGSGSFSFILSTSNADEGTYYVTVSVNPSATAQFVLTSDEPTRPQIGNETIFDIPAGIAFTKFVFLPIVLR